MFLTVISMQEDTTLLNNKSNEHFFLNLKLSSYFVYWKLAIHIQVHIFSVLILLIIIFQA